MLQAVVFDFDGVIADSELLHYEAFNKAFAPYGVNVPKQQHWEKYLGLTDSENIRAVDNDYNMNLTEQQREDILRLKTQAFIGLAGKRCVIFDGVVGLVESLAKEGISMAICSGATLEDIKVILKNSGLAEKFAVIITADDVVLGKPQPEGFLLAIEKLSEKTGYKLEPRQVVAVEDSRWGLQAAAAAGMHTIAVANTYPADRLGRYAEMVVDSIGSLTVGRLQGLCK